MITTDKNYNLETIGLLVDYHLLQLRVTTGVYLNNNSIVDIAKPTGNNGLYFNGINYNESSIAQVEQTISFNKLSPYVGLGWGNNSNREGWTVTLGVGLMYHDDSIIDLDIMFNPNISESQAAEIQSNAVAEIKIQERDLSDFPFYPVVMVGFNYLF